MDEWHHWVAFQHLFDLPDPFFHAVALAEILQGLFGEGPPLRKIVPYYASPKRDFARLNAGIQSLARWATDPTTHAEDTRTVAPRDH